jgi:hypothetical protein
MTRDESKHGAARSMAELVERTAAAAPPRRELGRARLYVSAEELVRFLDLPAGTHVRAVQASIDPPSVWIVIEHVDLPEVLPDQESPALQSEVVLEGGSRRFVYDFPAFRDRVNHARRWVLR